jgi:hypothetical protein
MYEMAFGAQVAYRTSQSEARSALPDAPVIAEPHRPERPHRIRFGLAGGLRRAADRLEPAVSQCA